MKSFLLLLLSLLFFVHPTIAQDGNSPITYSNLALEFSQPYYNSDAATGVFPAVASMYGIGGYMANPASIGMAEESFFNISFDNSFNNFESTYLDNSSSTEEDQSRLGNIGFVYKLPTKRGSFVIGGTYSNVINSTRNTLLSARNNNSTITDSFKEPDSDYYDLAFDTYAIDWGDVDSTYLESIFRIGFEDFPGITQEADISYSTNIGEYSFFLGTEFQKDLFLGISAGITSGNYSYRRDFLEIDDQNDYNFEFIPSDVEGEFTDIDNILTHDEIDANIFGFNLRAGLLYKLNGNMNIGVSYQIPSTVVVKESYYSSIRTELDDGSTPFETDLASSEDFEYRVLKPGELSAGIALKDLNGIDLTVSGQYIDYSNLNLDLISGNNFSFYDKVPVREQEEELNNFMNANYKRIFNYQLGLAYSMSKNVELKAAYAHQPGRSRVYEVDKTILSAGISTKIAKNVIVDVSGQYTSWDDRSVVYSYTDFESGQNFTETVDHEIEKTKILAGIRILF